VLSGDDFRIRTVEDLLGLWDRGAGPNHPCFCCQRTRWWHLKPTARLPKGGSWICGVCHPPGPGGAQIEWRGAR
jgi:hypothetical protein